MSWIESANRLTKWRRHFALWQLGSSREGTQEFKAVSHHRELSMIMRAELNALTKIVLEAKLVTSEEMLKTFEEEFDLLSEDYAKAYPGITAFDWGLDIKMPEAEYTLRLWEEA